MLGLSKLKAAISERRTRARFPRSVIHPGASVSKGCTLGDFSVLFSGARLHGSTLGAYSYVQSGSVMIDADVGPFCSIASGVTIGLVAHPSTMVSTSPVFYDPRQPLPKFMVEAPLPTESRPRTVVEADVWVGQGAMIKAGVRVGAGAVLGAGAVVTKDVAPYAIVGGVPAKTIRFRFSADLCHRLAESRWWELDAAALELLAPHFASPDRFLDALQNLPARSTSG